MIYYKEKIRALNNHIRMKYGIEPSVYKKKFFGVSGNYLGLYRELLNVLLPITNNNTAGNFKRWSKEIKDNKMIVTNYINSI